MNRDPKDVVSSDELDVNTLRLVLEEQRRAFDKVDASADSLDQKLQALFGSASLIISLVGTVQIAVLRAEAGLFFWGVMILAVLLYGTMVIVILVGLRPLEYYEPTYSNWDLLNERFFHQIESDAITQQIALYVDYIEANRALNQAKIRWLNIAAVLFAVILMMLLIAVPFSLTR